MDYCDTDYEQKIHEEDMALNRLMMLPTGWEDEDEYKDEARAQEAYEREWEYGDEEQEEYLYELFEASIKE